MKSLIKMGIVASCAIMISASAMSAPLKAAKSADAPQSSEFRGVVSASYWMGDYSSDGDSGDAKFVPVITGNYQVSGEYYAIARYGKSKDFTVSDEEMNTKFLDFGVMKTFADQPYYAFLIKKTTKTSESWTGAVGNSKFDGYAVGAGYINKFEGQPYTAEINVTYGPKLDASGSSTIGGIYSTMDGDAKYTAIDLKVTYDLGSDKNYTPFLGYRQEKYSCNDITVTTGTTQTVVTGLEDTYKGFYGGIDYKF